MFTSLRQRAGSQEGFTLIELLVVILIIGILAAIAIPNFLGQTARANDASAKSNARNAVSAVESCFTDTQTYAGCTDTLLSASGLTAGSAAGQVAITGQSATQYTITATSQSGNLFRVIYNSASTPQYSYTCTRTGSANGGCPTGQTWN